MEPELMPKPLPRGFFPLEEICYYCAYFYYKGDFERSIRGEGSAYCNFHKKYFPNQMEQDHLAAGARTCEHWEQQGTVKGER